MSRISLVVADRLRAVLPALALGLAVATAVGRPASVRAAAAPVPALPHLKLKASFPARDTVLTSAPDAVRLWLTEKAELPATRISVTNAAKQPVAVATPTRGSAADAPIEAKFTQPLAAGAYTVTWRTMSRDGHVVSGTFGFTVRTP